MESNYRFSLDKSSKKFLCPSCHKRRFVRYRDTEEKEYMLDYIGRCDRQSSCGYHYSPRQYFMDKPQAKEALFKDRNWQPTRIVQPPPVPDFINPALVVQSMKCYDSNKFVVYLWRLFGEELTQKLIQQFKIGTSAKWGRGGVIFWQIDANLQPRSGKIMLYDASTGRRVKSNGKPQIDWVHSVLKRMGTLQNFNLQQCLFGEHQIADESYAAKTIAIVESEKTAILMTAIYPDFLWMACGSANNMKAITFERLADRKVVLYPDLGCYELWKLKMNELETIVSDVKISDLLENNATAEQKKSG